MATVFLQVLALATLATAAPTKMATPPSSAAGSFLRACCGLTNHPDACYNLLLPYAESFHNSRARVAHTAATIAVARLHRFAKDLQSLKLHAIEAGRVANMSVAYCNGRVSDGDKYADEMLGHFGKLASGMIKNRRDFSSEKHQALRLVSDALSGMTVCVDLLHDAGEKALSTQVVKEVIARCEDVTLYMDIAGYITYATKF